MLKVNQIGAHEVEVFVPCESGGEHILLYPYNTPVAARFATGTCARTEQFFSRTTTKHIHNWLGDANYVAAWKVPQAVINALSIGKSLENSLAVVSAINLRQPTA